MGPGGPSALLVVSTFPPAPKSAALFLPGICFGSAGCALPLDIESRVNLRLPAVSDVSKDFLSVDTESSFGRFPNPPLCSKLPLLPLALSPVDFSLAPAPPLFILPRLRK